MPEPRPTEICVSILSADFARLGEQVREAADAGARRFQIDVMDGVFVPNITFGALAVEACRKNTDGFLEAHLMIVQPEHYIEDFAKAGADMVIVHQEAVPHLHRAIKLIHDLGMKAGVAINPSTPLVMLEEMLPYLDLVLVMTINPGFGGQEFIESMLPKLERLKATMIARNLSFDIEVDGGIHPATAPRVVQAGANVLVSGSGIYNKKQTVAEAFATLRRSYEGL